MNSWKTWRGLWVTALVCLACAVGAGQAETSAEPQKDKKAKKSHIVEVDLSALPKDLAKELKSYLKARDTTPAPEPKDRKGKKAKGEDKKAKGDDKKGKAKKGDDSSRTADLERQLDRLIRELEDLRREIRRR